MRPVESGSRLLLQNFLFLTDFSEASELALPFAISLTREYQGKLHALHVITPVPLAYANPETAITMFDGMEEAAQLEMQRIDSELAGLNHEIRVAHCESVWSGVAKALGDRDINLVVLGTHGRTGATKLLLGSVAEEIFRRSRVPVLTAGPLVRNGSHSGGHFHRILYATDFTREAQAAAPYAVSLAEENQARLLLINVLRDPAPRKVDEPAPDSIANVMHQLYEIVPQSAEVWCRPEALVQFGEPAERILQAAADHDADLIVLGVRDASGRMGAATHLGRTTAHRVVAHARCPVLTVRG